MSIKEVLGEIEKYDDEIYFKSKNENVFQKDVRKFLKSLGIFTIKMPSGMFEKTVVLPDLLCMAKKDSDIIEDRFFFIELKKPTGAKSKIQKATFTILEKYVNIYTVFNWNQLRALVMNICS